MTRLGEATAACGRGGDPELQSRPFSLYDAENRLITVIDNDVASPDPLTEDLTTSYGYDGLGNQTSVRAPAASGTTFAVTRTVYNPDGTVAKVIRNCTNTNGSIPTVGEAPTCAGTTPLAADTNLATQELYDIRGNRIEEQAPNPDSSAGAVRTQYAYDVANRLCRVVENVTGSTNLGTLADPCSTATQTAGTATANVSTRYTYDGAGDLAMMNRTVRRLDLPLAVCEGRTGGGWPGTVRSRPKGDDDKPICPRRPSSSGPDVAS